MGLISWAGLLGISFASSVFILSLGFFSEIKIEYGLGDVLDFFVEFILHVENSIFNNCSIQYISLVDLHNHRPRASEKYIIKVLSLVSLLVVFYRFHS